MPIAESTRTTETDQFARSAQQHLLTSADLAALLSELPSGPIRFELHEGVLVTSPLHRDDENAKVSGRVTGLIGWLGDFAGLGEVRSGDGGILLQTSPDTVVGADAAFLTRDQLPPETTSEGWLITILALVVEVVSPNDTRPEVQQKVDRYLRAGVSTVWVIDPRPRTVTVHRSGEPALVLTEADNLTASDIIPELSFPIRKLFL